MAHVITDECLACGACEENCPVNAIVAEGDVYAIKEDCISCGACADICPVGAPKEE